MDTINDLLARGAQLIQDKKYTEAHDVLRQVVEQDPKNKLGWLLLGNSYSLEEDYRQALQIFEQADKACPDDAIITMSIGGSLRMLGRIDEAELYKLRAQTLDPTIVESVISLKKYTDIANLVNLEKPEESLLSLADYLIQNPATEPAFLKIIAEGFYQIGRQCSQQNKPEQAEKAYNQAIDVLKTVTGLEPADAEAYVTLGNVFYYQNEKTQAFDQYKISLSKSPSLSLAEKAITKIALNLERYQDVLDILTTQPDLISPFKKEKLTGYAELGLEHPEKAAEAFQRALQIIPDDAPVHEVLADVCRQLKDSIKARQHYGKAVELISKQISDLGEKLKQLTAIKNHSPEGLSENDLAKEVETTRQTLGQLEYQIGDILLKQGEDIDEAWVHWQETVRVSPNSTDTQAIAKKLYDLNHWDKASEVYTALQQDSPPPNADASLLFKIGVCYFFLFRYAEARTLFEKASLISDTYQYLANYWLGECYTYERNFAKAEPYYREAFRLKPDEFFIIEGLIKCLTAERKRDEALAVCQKANSKYADTAPDEQAKQQRSAEILYLTGNLYLDLKELDDAIRSYRGALEIDSSHVFAQHNLAHVLEKQGKYADARHEWSNAKESYQSHLEKPLPT